MREFAGDIQQEFAGLFDRLFTDGIGAFADMGRNIKGIFKNLASNIARSLIFQPQVLGIAGLGGPGWGRLASLLQSIRAQEIRHDQYSSNNDAGSWYLNRSSGRRCPEKCNEATTPNRIWLRPA